jgi:serine/threonine protein kinase
MEPPLAKPMRIGAYDIVSVIGRGGMGTVYKATDPRIDRSVAVKVLTAAADDPDLLLRFYREAKYTGSLQHQNIVTVYELGHQDGVPYLVMEYLEGVSLEALIASGRPMPIAEKLKIILQVCSGLSYAHKRDLVHRDIKPANIVILENGTAKIVDFGIARLGGNRVTRTGHVVGSLNYMSPEQLNGNVEVDLRTDVYSVGVVLFQLLTGVLPFDGGSTAATLMKIVQEPPPPLGKYLKGCPPELEAITQKALAKNREERYASADDFALDLGRLQQQYEKQLLADYLQQAAESLQRKDFVAARQQVLQVLRAAPQNTEGGDLLRLIKKGQEQQQRELQAQQFQLKAEAAFRRNDLAAARQFVEEGLRFDPSSTELLTLQDAIKVAQAKVARCHEALRRAEAALKLENLEAARQCIDEASAILPDDPACTALASQIAARIAQRLREQEEARQRKLREEEEERQRKAREEEAERQRKLHEAEEARLQELRELEAERLRMRREQEAAEKQKQFAIAVNAVEKVMAEARMLMFLGQTQEALQSLEKAENEVSQLPARWSDQFDALRKEALAKIAETHRAVTGDWAPGGQTGDMAAPSNATVMMQPGLRTSEIHGRFDAPHPEPELSEHGAFAPPEPAFTHEEKREIAPELMEFLEPVQSGRSRPMIWIGIAAAILVVVVLSMLLFPRQARVSDTKPVSVGAKTDAVTYTYAEINAEPWGTIKKISPANGEAQSAVGSVTPIRVKLPAGQYSLTLEGPNHEQKQVDITVPSQGGTTCVVPFLKPDLKRLLSQK